MKWLLIFMGLVIVAVSAQGIPVDLDVSLGLVGAGIFLPHSDEKEQLFVPSVGGLLRMAYRLLESKAVIEGKRDVYIDGGILVYATTGIIETNHLAFIGGLGITLGFFNGVITISFCPSYVYDFTEGVGSATNSGLYWAFVFTSDSLEL